MKTIKEWFAVTKTDCIDTYIDEELSERLLGCCEYHDDIVNTVFGALFGGFNCTYITNETLWSKCYESKSFLPYYEWRLKNMEHLSLSSISSIVFRFPS